LLDIVFASLLFVVANEAIQKCLTEEIFIEISLEESRFDEIFQKNIVQETSELQRSYNKK